MLVILLVLAFAPLTLENTTAPSPTDGVRKNTQPGGTLLNLELPEEDLAALDSLTAGGQAQLSVETTSTNDLLGQFQKPLTIR